MVDSAAAMLGWPWMRGGRGIDHLVTRRAARRADLVRHRLTRATRVLLRGRDELAEQRRRLLRARLELGVELRGDEERVVVELDDLDQALVRRGAGDDEARGLQALAQGDRNLIAVAVALVDH